MTQLHRSNAEARPHPFGFLIAILTSVMAIICLGIAVLTPPLSGPFCTGSCFEYPYHDIASRFPRDYLWMYPAMVLSLCYVALIAASHHYAVQDRKIYGNIGLSFAVISATILLVDYFVQIAVIQPSLLQGETEGIAILTQYNPHGIFIALEEIGYLMMGLSFLCIAPVFSGKQRLEKTIRRVFIISFIITLISLILISAIHGLAREYRFEVVVITIDWLVLIINGILISRHFKHAV